MLVRYLLPFFTISFTFVSAKKRDPNLIFNSSVKQERRKNLQKPEIIAKTREKLNTKYKIFPLFYVHCTTTISSIFEYITVDNKTKLVDLLSKV